MTVRTLIRLIIGMALISVNLIAVSCDGSESEPTPTPGPAPEPEPATETPPEVKLMNWDSPPPMSIDTGKKYTAIMETVKGTLVLVLFAADVPGTVNNFVFLARQGYYDGTTFHRVLADFMTQGGDQTGTGRGGPGYSFEDEFTEHGHVAGALSMANSGPNTNGSQFFITFVAVHQLDGRHTVFGQLVEGMDVLESITLRDPSQNPQFEGDKIIRVTIEEE